jgi:aryl-alcohol dehydrogenase-like predicted oxidoreductase
MQLNHYRLLGRSGLRVSPLCLGTMTFGTEWGWGADKETSRAIFDRYTERGGNFMDTANRYTEGTSETWLGEFWAGRREQFVLASKYTMMMRPGDPNSAGNQRKNMVQSVEASLRRLKTDYLDLYWMHAWDQLTPIEEVMRAFDDLVRAGKILHIGISNAPAWKVAQANTLAELRGWTAFSGLQVRYSLVDRSVERDLLPMAREFNIGVTPYAALAGGVLTGKYNQTRTGEAKPRLDVTGAAAGITEKRFAIAAEVMKIAGEIGRTPAQVALAWVLAQPGITSPIIGVRTLEQLEDNLASLECEITAEHMARLVEISKLELGYPHDIYSFAHVQKDLSAGTVIERKG